MGLLTKQQIINADDLRTEDIECPEWGGSVRVRALTAKERDAYEASLMKRDGKKYVSNFVNARAKLVGLCLIDDGGARLFNDDEVSSLGEKSCIAMNRVFEACQRLAGLSQEDIDDLVKKSEPGLNGSSPSISASPSDEATQTSSSPS
jgi:hypothetical protein